MGTQMELGGKSNNGSLGLQIQRWEEFRKQNVFLTFSLFVFLLERHLQSVFFFLV